LRNYTNFDTLRVLGLDGADTFNVTTLGHRPQPQSVRGRFALGREEVDRQLAPRDSAETLLVLRSVFSRWAGCECSGILPALLRARGGLS
jgi:hypothetical protein